MVFTHWMMASMSEGMCIVCIGNRNSVVTSLFLGWEWREQLVPWVRGPPGAFFGFYLREAFQS